MTHCHPRNLAVYKKQTPLPNIDKLIELVDTYQAPNKKDLVNGYFNIRVEESSERWNTILTTYSKMRSRVKSQGDYNATGAITEAMLDIFRYVAYQYLVIYIDDIIIYSRTYESHVRNLK